MTFLAVLWWICKLIALICVFIIIMCVLAGLIRTLAEIIDPPRKKRRILNEIREELELEIETRNGNVSGNVKLSLTEYLDIYNQAKAFMASRIGKEYGTDVTKWPSDVSKEFYAACTASDMVKDIMIAIISQKVKTEEASKDDHSPVYKEEPENEDKE